MRISWAQHENSMGISQGFFVFFLSECVCRCQELTVHKTEKSQSTHGIFLGNHGKGLDVMKVRFQYWIRCRAFRAHWLECTNAHRVTKALLSSTTAIINWLFHRYVHNLDSRLIKEWSRQVVHDRSPLGSTRITFCMALAYRNHLRLPGTTKQASMQTESHKVEAYARK